MIDKQETSELLSKGASYIEIIDNKTKAKEIRDKLEDNIKNKKAMRY